MASAGDAFSGTMTVRPEHAIDTASLQRFLEANVQGFRGPMRVEQFRGGQSNPTFLVWGGDRRYVVRRKPSGPLLPSAHAVDREYRVITALGGTGVPVPRTHALCEDPAVIGTAFYVMDFVDGRIFWDPTLPGMSPAERSRIYDGMNDALARLHGVDPAAAGLSDYGKPGSYFARQLSRWSKQYQTSRAPPIPSMDRLVERLPALLPAADETRVVHGDFRIDNMVYHPTEPRVLALLDWELSTLGHPMSDLAYNCMIWRLPPESGRSISAADLTGLGIPSEKEYVAAYCARTGRAKIDDWDFCVAFSMFRLAAILHGIAGRIVEGTAASEHAVETASRTQPIADAAWDQLVRAGLC